MLLLSCTQAPDDEAAQMRPPEPVAEASMTPASAPPSPDPVAPAGSTQGSVFMPTPRPEPADTAAEPFDSDELGVDECLATVATGTLEAKLRPANILFLVDRSASLDCNLPPITDSASCESDPKRADPSQPTKWDVVRDAIGVAIEELPPSASAAITYFNNDDRCGVQSAPHVPLAHLDAVQRAAIVDSMGAVEPRGGTPIVGGLILAYKRLNPDQTAGLPPGNRFVVLLTDGEEGCAPEETGRLLETELPKSRQARITTFVVGVPGSEVNRGFLSRLAFAGGAPSFPMCDHESSDPMVGDCHFDMTRETDLATSLRTALGTITEHVLGCEFDLPEPDGAPVDYERVNVVYTEASGEQGLVKQDAERPCDAGANGWKYSEDRSKVMICGQACDRVRRAASIRIALGCRSVVVVQ